MRKRFLVPSFLQKFDTWLLKHRPAAWSARTHFVLYYAVFFSAVVTTFAFLSFTDARQWSSASVWAWFTALAAFTGFVAWLIFLLRFNVFKRFGNWKRWEGLQMFGLYLINIAMLVFTVFIPFIVECVNANRAYGGQELVNDINEINLTVCQLDNNILPKKFNADTLELIKADTATVTDLDEEGYQKDIAVQKIEDVDSAAVDYVTEPATVYRPNYNSTSDTSDFYSRINRADSIKKLGDSMYVIFDCPSYIFARSYEAEEYLKDKVLSSFEIYNRVIKNYKQPDRTALLKRMKHFDEKYVTSHYVYSDQLNKSYNTIIEEKYFIREINRSIDNIARKKYWWANDWEMIVRIFWYTTLLLTLLLFIFRSTTIKTFFLSLLAAVILLIGTGIIIGVFGMYDEKALVFILVYYLVFLAAAFSIRLASVRTALQGIALNFTLFLTAFIPLTAVSLYFEIIEKKSYITHRYDALIAKRDLYSFYAEITGVVLLLILLEPMFRKLYKRWFALPEE